MTSVTEKSCFYPGQGVMKKSEHQRRREVFQTKNPPQIKADRDTCSSVHFVTQKTVYIKITHGHTQVPGNEPHWNTLKIPPQFISHTIKAHRKSQYLVNEVHSSEDPNRIIHLYSHTDNRFREELLKMFKELKEIMEQIAKNN